MNITKRSIAELIGTFWLVFGGCGSALYAAGVPNVGIGYAGVALAFGLTVLTMAFAIGHISGAHLNPAVTIGLIAAKRFDAKDAPFYIVAQIIGAILAAAALYAIASGHAGFSLADGFAANGYAEHSPSNYSMTSAFIAETILTAIFLIIIIGSTDKRAPKGLAPIAIGLALTLIHLISIPITNTSVNPARSISQAIFVGDWALNQLWLFIAAPILGAIIAGLCYLFIFEDKNTENAANTEEAEEA